MFHTKDTKTTKEVFLSALRELRVKRFVFKVIR